MYQCERANKVEQTEWVKQNIIYFTKLLKNAVVVWKDDDSSCHSTSVHEQCIILKTETKQISESASSTQTNRIQRHW